ncbi:MAG: HD domain-containing protein [Clostridia bacterium]|nr:HD domain-containing protein [Clostridia bacterium]
MKNTRDVLSSGSKKDDILRATGLALLIFFLLGYLIVTVFSEPDMMVSMILFFGSIFVTIVLFIMFKLLETVKTRSVDIAKVLIGVVDARDPNLNGHSVHVQKITMLLYSYLPKHMKKDINPISLEYAAILHDVGKLGVPESILNKPAKLTEEEWTVMRKHPQLGVKFLEPLAAFGEINSWIFCHHERVDGNGYFKLKGEEIPFAAKMLSIADTYSAITMRRSYKTPRTHDDAIAIIKEAAGTQLDKQLVDIFLTIPKEELEKCIPEGIKY